MESLKPQANHSKAHDLDHEEALMIQRHLKQITMSCSGMISRFRL